MSEYLDALEAAIKREGLSNAADELLLYARKLEMESEERELLPLVVAAIEAHRRLHQSYDSTSVCHGGMGGQAITAHCGEVCYNDHAHVKQRAAWENVERAYFAYRNGEPDWKKHLAGDPK